MFQFVILLALIHTVENWLILSLPELLNIITIFCASSCESLCAHSLVLYQHVRRLYARSTDPDPGLAASRGDDDDESRYLLDTADNQLCLTIRGTIFGLELNFT